MWSFSWPLRKTSIGQPVVISWHALHLSPRHVSVHYLRIWWACIVIVGNAHVWKHTRHHLECVLRNNNPSFQELSYFWLRRYWTQLLLDNQSVIKQVVRRHSEHIPPHTLAHLVSYPVSSQSIYSW